MKRILLTLAAFASGFVVLTASADVPNRTPPNGMVPNPGTQEKELTNISTGPGQVYNVFDFPNFCAGCHGGTIDPNVSHYGNWSGSNMANSGRDPFFRANNLVVNADAYYATGGQNGGLNGVGNICWRCHSPNGWYSARLDETLGGRIDGSTLQQSLLASTDMQGISCEFCHRTIGNVTQKRADLSQTDPAWNMLAGALDWPHQGNPYPEGPVAGNPYGDTSFQFGDARVYQADLPGTDLLFWSDIPTSGTYTGQTYGIYPPGWTGPRIAPVPFNQPRFNALGQEIVYLPDGRSSIQNVVGVGAPEAIDPVTGLPIPGTRDPWEQSQSPAHRTHMGGSTQDGLTASGIKYLTSSEMCGTCHDLTVPTLNSGMPEQRTYTEWKYSTYGNPASPNFVICQDCHMGEGQHEYQDGAVGTYKADGAKAGWFPFAKPRPASAVHRFSPANRDLPQILKLLNPDVDMEITGRPTGRDTRTVSGVLSNRDEAWNRHSRYGELKLRDAARVQVLGAPVEVSPGVYEAQVKVTNLSGHALPSGYPDGRRAFVIFKARDANGNVLYQSGDYDLATAELHTAPGVPLARAHDALIDAAAGKNAVMIYEKRTGYPNPDGTYTMGESLLNPVILFDNRLRPDGWTAELFTAGVRLVDYSGTETAAVPFNKPDRFPVGQGFDVITYRFRAPAGVVPTAAEAEFFYQSHTREFVEYLKDRNNEETALDQASGRTPKLGGPRPEGTPSILAPGYPNTPNYLGGRVGIPGRLDLSGKPLQDNWGSLVYAAWLDTGKGEPFLIDSDGSSVAAPPAAPASVTASAIDPFAIQVGWAAVPDAAGYFVQVRFGTATVDATYGPTASWEPLAIVRGATSFRHEGLHVSKTYGYRVIAFNGKGESPPSAPAEATTPAAPAAAPSALVATATAATSVSLQWQDNAIDETGFVVERRDGTAGAFVAIATVAPVSVLGTGPVGFVDGSVLEGRTYGYRVAAINAAGPTYSNVAQVTTPATLPASPSLLAVTNVAQTTVTLSWQDGATNETSFVVERRTGAGPFLVVASIPAANVAGTGPVSYTDATVVPSTAYGYRVAAVNSAGQSGYSNVVTVTTLAPIPAAPKDLKAILVLPTSAFITWKDASTNETGFVVERSLDGKTFVPVGTTAANVRLFQVTGLKRKTTYWFRVKAMNGSVPSGYSNGLNFKTW